MSAAAVSVTSTLAMVLAARARGVKVEPLLEEAGLTMAMLESPDERIPVEAALALWDQLRARSGDPALQLEAPLALPYGAYRVLEYLVSSSPTVGDGVRRFAKYFALINPRVTLAVEGDGHEMSLRASQAGGGAVPPVYVDYVFAALIGRVRMRPRPDLRVARVELRRGEPPCAAAYSRSFRAPIAFGAPCDRLCFSLGEWDSPMATRDTTLAEILDEHARIRSAALGGGHQAQTRRVREAIVAMLPEGARIERVSRSLGVSPRTLQRTLARAETSFSAQLEQARRHLAEAYLGDGAASIGEIALLLGFGDQSSFQRAFRRWTGEPPGRWRRRRRGFAPGSR